MQGNIISASLSASVQSSLSIQPARNTLGTGAPSFGKRKQVPVSLSSTTNLSGMQTCKQTAYTVVGSTMGGNTNIPLKAKMLIGSVIVTP